MIRNVKSSSRIRFLLPPYIMLLLVMFILPFYSVDGYSLLMNTTSHLGAQHAPNAWIMNSTFTFLGSACILEAWMYVKKYWIQTILLIIFGSGLILTSIFQHAPINEGMPYSVFEDNTHSLFASVVGFSFTLFAVSVAFIEKTNRKRILALFIGLFATGLSLLMFNVPNYAGLWQRILFIVTFGWLILFLERLKIDKRNSVSKEHLL
jgi:hypothetical membrane protein